MIKQCKKCGSENLYLEPRVKGQDVLNAAMVALKCKDCGTWLKWCPKDERQFYINKNEKTKLEEKDRRIKELEKERDWNKHGLECNGASYVTACDEISQLKQQLKEKDEEIARLRNIKIKF